MIDPEFEWPRWQINATLPRFLGAVGQLDGCAHTRNAAGRFPVDLVLRMAVRAHATRQGVFQLTWRLLEAVAVSPRCAALACTNVTRFLGLNEVSQMLGDSDKNLAFPDKLFV